MNKLNNVAKAIIISCGATWLSACGESTSSSAGPDFGAPTLVENEFDEATLVANLTDQVITPVYENFLGLAQSQTSAIGNYCAKLVEFSDGAVDSADVEQSENAVKQGFQDAFASWQQIEMMQIGPLVNNEGQLRNKIYSWPVTSNCGVDLDVTFFEADDINGAPYDITIRTPARKGFDALEYLLFNENLDHSCTGSTFPAGWNARSEEQRQQTRCQYASVVAGDIVANASIMLDEWNGSDGYANTLKQAGTVGSPFATVHDAVNRISDAIFYIDSFTKDGKLATPLGLFANECGSQACPQEVESPYSASSLNNIKQNLLALQALYTGADGVGFDDFLLDVGDTATHESLITGINNALQIIDSYEQSLAETLLSDEQMVTDTHESVKDITDVLKADFINSLALELPATSAGDND